MKTDKYTKIILTVIAINLTVISIKSLDLIPKANANTLSKTNYGLVPVNSDGSITVKFNQNSIMDVRLRGIEQSSLLSWEPIYVKTKQ
jgi:hypothetical protein